MAKRGTLDHPKNKRLARALKTFHGVTLGLLETIWHQAAQFHANGTMSKLDLEDAFDAGGWLGQFTAEQLIQALSNHDHAWLDVLPDGNYYIHDWHNHCDDSTHAKLYRSLSHFGNGSKPLCRKVYGEEKSELAKQWSALDIQRTSAGHPPDILPCLALPSQAKPIHSPAAPPAESDSFFEELPESLSDARFKPAWLSYEKYLAEVKGKPMHPSQRPSAWAELLKVLPPGGDAVTAIGMINQSIAHGWVGFYPPNYSKKSPPARASPTTEQLRIKAEKRLAFNRQHGVADSSFMQCDDIPQEIKQQVLAKEKAVT